MKLVGLIDCNNFFVSCERVFAPALVGRPVVVAGNNGGCVVAMSGEAKALGIMRGLPVFKARDLMRRHDVVVIPGNHRLYGDLSARVMSTIESVGTDIEVYSIDEAFIHFPDMEPENVEKMAREIVIKVRRDVGIPTSLGIAPTKTLAKVAARVAKKNPAQRAVYMIDSEERRRDALRKMEVGDIWGIGRHLVARLKKIGIGSALEFADMPESDIRRVVNVTGQRTWRELNGVACVEKDPEADVKKQICTTRTFASSVSDLPQLRELVSLFMSKASLKLRRQRSAAKGISVFIQTNSYLKDSRQYCNSVYRQLEEPTNDQLTLVSQSIDALDDIYREGLSYRRAGVIITDIIPQEAIQPTLFSSADDRAKRNRLNDSVDHINSMSEIHDKIRVAATSHENYLIPGLSIPL